MQLHRSAARRRSRPAALVHGRAGRGRAAVDAAALGPRPRASRAPASRRRGDGSERAPAASAPSRRELIAARLSRCPDAHALADNRPMTDASRPPPTRPTDRRAAGARRRPRARPLARARRPVVHADARRPRRRRDQGRAPGRDGIPAATTRAAGGRRSCKDSAGARHRRGRLLPRHQPQQALDHDRHRHARGRRRWCATRARSATCFVENFKVGDMARYGLDAASAARAATRASSTARSPASARPAPTASAPATTTRSRAWAA